ncbi:hypothetical protein CCAX7_56300 [Capsulimonas corticalis]|uniref:DUF6916 domain-containing protein n=1 Tax=Capsulimonas corticalis TaxID=2219043 RepID=A0A402D0L1_9BACT|nr:hypothetical protein [Capsulimonas corticalis]BDI33579.1 hypothetical protein CCAX7_56300 [Capsulimonas corticalis]
MSVTILLSHATAEDFSPLLNTEFSIATDDGGSAQVTLSDVKSVGVAMANARQPFVLTFTGTPGLVLPQRIYRISHPGVNDIEIFIVPIAATAQATTYEAIFS